MNGFSLTTRLTASDWNAYQAACMRRAQGRGWRGAALIIGAPIAMGLLIYGLMRVAHGRVEVNWLFAGILVGYGALLLVSRLIRLWTRPLADAAFLGQWNFDFSPVGVRIRRPHADSTTSWAGVREITCSADHLFIWIDTIAAFIVPIRDLPGGLSSGRALSALHDLKTQASGVQDANDVGAACQPADTYSMGRAQRSPRSVANSMRALIQWLTWRRFDGRALDAPDLAILVIAFVSLGLLLVLNRIGVGPNPHFNAYGAQSIACKVLGILAVGWLTWRATDPQTSWRAVLFVLAALALVDVPAQWGIDHLASGSSRAAASLGLLALLVIYLGRALKFATGRSQQRAVAIALVALLIGGSIVAPYLDMGPLWYVPEHEETDGYSRSRQQAENLLMGQPARIDAAVAAMAPRSGDTSTYMVGFAGVGEQKVFAGEISLAARVVGDRYGTRKRTLLLINDQRDLESRPLASVTGLKLGLADIARRMNRDHDVLFLVISSHGSKEPAISVSNGGIPLNDLTGKDLRDALEQAGIRWRVVIISACHAGAFIPYLKDDRTIVVTAAAEDRTSFGCSNDRDLTNFGEAFIRDALPKAPSIRAAFEQARESIAARERAEKLTPSIPTAYFGEAIERKLQDDAGVQSAGRGGGTP